MMVSARLMMDPIMLAMMSTHMRENGLLTLISDSMSFYSGILSSVLLNSLRSYDSLILRSLRCFIQKIPNRITEITSAMELTTMYHFSAFTRGLTCAVVGQLLFFLELLHAAVDGQSDVGDGEADVDDVEADAAGPALQGIPSNIVEDGDEGEVPEKDAQELEGLDFVPSFMEEVAEKRDDKE